jgi:2-oxoglutarate ferredoxin oxidoreductase subunit delta
MKPDLGKLSIDADGCKGCGLCVEVCNLKVLTLSDRLNRNGYRIAGYAGHGCNGCGLCFYACPEPGVLTVYKIVAEGALA